MAAAVTTYIATARALPGCSDIPIVLFGAMWNDGNLAASQSIETAVQTAVVALNDPWLRFINTKSNQVGNTAPIWGQGTASAPSGTGNSDWAFQGGSVNHPSTEGAFHIARFAFDSIKGALASMLAAA